MTTSGSVPRAITAGTGYVGLHRAADACHRASGPHRTTIDAVADPCLAMLGAESIAHGGQQKPRITVADPAFPGSNENTDGVEMTEERYTCTQFQQGPHVLLVLDPAGLKAVPRQRGPCPVRRLQPCGKGQVPSTANGHRHEVLASPIVATPVTAGIDDARGRITVDETPNREQPAPKHAGIGRWAPGAATAPAAAAPAAGRARQRGARRRRQAAYKPAMPERDSHCSACGRGFPADQPWPRQCAGCGMVSHSVPVPAVAVLLPVHDSVLLVRHAGGAHAGQLSLPGGGIELGEGWQQAAVRRLKLESGVTVAPGELTLFDVVPCDDQSAGGGPGQGAHRRRGAALQAQPRGRRAGARLVDARTRPAGPCPGLLKRFLGGRQSRPRRRTSQAE